MRQIKTLVQSIKNLPYSCCRQSVPYVRHLQNYSKIIKIELVYINLFLYLKLLSDILDQLNELWSVVNAALAIPSPICLVIIISAVRGIWTKCRIYVALWSKRLKKMNLKTLWHFNINNQTINNRVKVFLVRYQ